jgi:hypothetical protein
MQGGCALVQGRAAAGVQARGGFAPVVCPAAAARANAQGAYKVPDPSKNNGMPTKRNQSNAQGREERRTKLMQVLEELVSQSEEVHKTVAGFYGPRMH